VWEIKGKTNWEYKPTDCTQEPAVHEKTEGNSFESINTLRVGKNVKEEVDGVNQIESINQRSVHKGPQEFTRGEELKRSREENY